MCPKTSDETKFTYMSDTNKITQCRAIIIHNTFTLPTKCLYLR